MSKHIDWFKNLEIAVGKSFISPAMMQIAEGRIQLKDLGAGKELVVNESGELIEVKLPNYLCFTAQQDGSTIKMIQVSTDASDYDLQVSYDGKTWEQYTLGNTIALNNGEMVYWRGNNDHFGIDFNCYKGFVMSGKIAASGNINSLLNANDFDSIDTIPSNYCYSKMFIYCTSLTTAPELPATTLSKECYNYMFVNCTSLTTAPELPATTLAYECYNYMFYGCTSLTAAPELPATTLANSCYRSMFSGCTSLAAAPELPATTLTQYCYGYMFLGCTSLTTAPELPATTLTYRCYQYMFKDCTKLSYIKAMFTDWSASGCLDGWVNGVASNGTFVKNTASTFDTRGNNGIPEGWTVETAAA